jgi:hypothetical protein
VIAVQGQARGWESKGTRWSMLCRERLCWAIGPSRTLCLVVSLHRDVWLGDEVAL